MAGDRQTWRRVFEILPSLDRERCRKATESALEDLGSVEDGMAIKTRPQKHEVCHVPAPGGSRFDVLGTIISRQGDRVVIDGQKYLVLRAKKIESFGTVIRADLVTERE